MFTLEEKEYLLSLLKRQRWHFFRRKPKGHDALIEKLEQMIRNEKINRD